MSLLRRIIIERRKDGRWDMVREMTETGDRWVSDDLNEAFDTVLRAFRPDGTPREVGQ